MENNDYLKILIRKVLTLEENQRKLSSDIKNLRAEIEQFANEEQPQTTKEEKPYAPVSTQVTYIEKEEKRAPIATPTYTETEERSFNWERFIGENLISKVGIIILIIGVIIGTKYAFDHKLISPELRITIGYIIGLSLLGGSFKLRQKYEKYSAVLASGASAILFFITYTSYALYGFFGMELTFAIMLLTTVGTVLLALSYNQQLIAHLGMVGAYAIPFLLASESHSISLLFSYIAIINFGILFIAFRRYWLSLYYSTFAFTWIIVLFWAFKNVDSIDGTVGLAFSTLFYVIFYFTFIAYNLIRNQKSSQYTTPLVISNSSIYFAVGYLILSHIPNGKSFLGLFALFNALTHVAIAYLLYLRKYIDKSLHYLVVGLVIVFITLAIVLQFDAKWSIVLLSAESALMLWMGLKLRVKNFEIYSNILIGLTFILLIGNWSLYSIDFMQVNKVATYSNLLTSIAFIAIATFITYLIAQSYKQQTEDQYKRASILSSWLYPSILIIAVYYTLRLEISHYYYTLYHNIPNNTQESTTSTLVSSALCYKTVLIGCFSLLFVSLLALINSWWLKHSLVARIIYIAAILTAISQLTFGLISLGGITETSLTLHPSQHGLRLLPQIHYLTLVIWAITILAIRWTTKRSFIQKNTVNYFDSIVAFIVLVLLSNEFASIYSVLGYNSFDKFDLSILWGLYAFVLITIGIIWRKRYLRIGSIALIGVTLAKLFIYDIFELDTLARTIAFISLGIFLLVVSFLYNKFKAIIFEEDAEK